MNLKRSQAWQCQGDVAGRDEEYNSMEAEVINKFIELGDESSRMDQYEHLEALKGLFTSDEDRQGCEKSCIYCSC